VSGKPFCYSAGKLFSFEQYSGRLSAGHAVFITSKGRKLAVLISQNGKADIAERINGVWKTRSELQQTQVPNGPER
jgi:hypothetical protein